MKRIVLATPLFPPEIGGPATDAFTLQGELSVVGVDTIVVPFASVRALPRVVRHLVYFFKLWRHSTQAQCVVAFDTVSVGFPAALAAVLAGVPLIVRVPGDYAWEQAVQRFGVRDSIDDFQCTRYDFRTEALRAIQNFVVRRADLVVVPSRYFKGVVAGWGVHQDRLTHIYLGIDTSLEAVRPPSVLPKTIFTVGRLVPWKGFSGIIELLPELPTWNLVIAGDGPEASHLRKKTHDLGVADRATFLGNIPRNEVLGWCSATDAFVLNTSFESFSFQVLEAMAQGARVVTTRVGSLPELLTDGKEGFLYEPGDTKALLEALRSIEQEPARWKDRQEAAQRKAETFSLIESGKRFTDAILKLCA